MKKSSTCFFPPVHSAKSRQHTRSQLAKSMMQESSVLSGDILSFNIDTLGFLATASNHEPIPEKGEKISHLRICTPSKSVKSASASDGQNVLLADFRRCMFKIEVYTINTICVYECMSV